MRVGHRRPGIRVPARTLQQVMAEVEQEARSVAQSVKMYTTTWCGYCVRTKRYLDGKGVAYEEINIEQHPEFAERIEQATGGYRTVPTLEIDGRLMVNPSPRELDEVLSA
jgi:mycoredoxin